MISKVLVVALAGIQVTLGDIWFTKQNSEWVMDHNGRPIGDSSGSLSACESACKNVNNCNVINYGKGGECKMFDLKVTFFTWAKSMSNLAEQHFKTEDKDGTAMVAAQLKQNDHWTALYILRTNAAYGEFDMDLLHEKIAQYGDGRMAPPTPRPIQSEMPDNWHGRFVSRFEDWMSDYAKLDTEVGYKAQEPAPTPKPFNSPTQNPAIQSEMPDYWHGGRAIDVMYGGAGRFVLSGAGVIMVVGVVFMACKKKLQVEEEFVPLV